MSTAFFKKYPDADPSRFVFKNEKVWFKLNPDNEYRLLDIESDTYQRTSTWTNYLTSYKERGFGIWFADGTKQKYDKNHETTYKQDINKIKIYVTEDKFFTTELTPYVITNTFFDVPKDNPYVAALWAAYVSTYICGISTKHLEYNKETPTIITSMVRYHLYFHMKKFLKYPNELKRYENLIAPFVRDHGGFVRLWEDTFYKTDMTLDERYAWAKNRDPKVRNYSRDEKRGGIVYQALAGTRNGDPNDYRRFISHKTDGLTKIGQKLLQQSVMSYVYAVLGAQAKTRWSIVGEGAKSLQTQDVFHKIVEETIVENDVTILISNMRTAIKNTNVVLNMAISPGMILVPSNLIIQKEKIPGYNNVLTLATDKMKFGMNAEVNYKAPIVIPKTESESSTQGGDTRSKSSKTINPKPKSPKVSVASEILGVTMMVGGFLISK